MYEQIFSLSEVNLSLRDNVGLVQILKGISLTIQGGETVGLTGASGSGKSSLLMILGGLEQASSGTVKAMGNDLTRMSEDSLARFRRSNMGIVFQSFHLIPTMTALENVATPLELAGESEAFERAEIELCNVGLKHRLNNYPAQLSGGEQQRVALARAVILKPRIILADEPTGNLDTRNGAAIIDVLFQLREKYGSTLVLVTHDFSLANQCDRVITLADGCIVSHKEAEH